MLLANYEGRIYAVSGICPHQLNPLEGAVLGDLLIDGPWRHFQFDCRNHFPASVYPKDLRKQLAPLKRYAVDVRDGDVWMKIE